MTTQIDKIFVPGIGIDIVFNIDSLSPISRSAIILECDYQSKNITISQTTPKILSSFKYDQMCITTLITKELSQKKRVGLHCELVRLINNYALSNKNLIPAILIRYDATIHDVNIRSAYRIQPTQNFDVAAKLIYDGNEYFSNQHFKIYDLSLTGVGILIPKTIKKHPNPLLERLEVGIKGKIGFILIESSGAKTGTTLSMSLRVIRKNKKFNELSGFAGFKFYDIKEKEEDKLNRFVHEAQLYEIRKISGLIK